MVLLACVGTVLIGFTNPLTNVDQIGIKRAERMCQALSKTPCLLQIEKTDRAHYKIICGPEEEK
jgi:hypothetical protein